MKKAARQRRGRVRSVRGDRAWLRTGGRACCQCRSRMPGRAAAPARDNAYPSAMSSVLDLARRLLALSQTGLHFTPEEYDRERYREDRATSRRACWRSNRRQRRRRQQRLVRRRRYCDAEDRRARRDLSRRPRAAGARASGRQVDDAGRLGRRQRLAGSRGRRRRSSRSRVHRPTVKLAALYDRNKHEHPPYLFHAWKAFFICEITGGDAAHQQRNRLRRVLPARRAAGAVHRPRDCAQIRRMYEHHLHPELPTEFD